MTYALMFIGVALLTYFLIRLCASRHIQYLYNELKKYELYFAYNACNQITYLKKYIDVVFFRHDFYFFLSNDLKNKQFKNRHIFISTVLPTISKKIDEDFSLKEC